MGFRDQEEPLRERIEAQDEEIRRLRSQLASSSAPARRRVATAMRIGPRALPFVALALLSGAGYLAMSGRGESAVVAGAVLATIAVTVGWLAVVLSLVEIVGPSEALVLLGRPQTLDDGSTVGFRVLQAGRAVRIPFVERAERMDLHPLDVESSIKAPLGSGTVSARYRAVVGFGREMSALHKSVERFVGLPREQVLQAATNVIEGTVREVLASSKTVPAGGDLGRLGDQIEKDATPSFQRMGLRLESFELLDVAGR